MKKIKHLKNKRVLAIAIPVIALIAIGGTIAVNRDRIGFTNNFKLAGYETLFTETFDAPQNWQTCETIDKTITATNDTDSSGPVSIRIKLEEQWLAADGTTELPLVSAASGLTMAQINFTPNSGWTQNGNYYYYDTDLAKGATSSSLITGVTLNCNANLSVTEAGADSAYGNATYHLKITAEGIDSASKDEWNNRLADIVANQANPDTPINFTQIATVATGNGNGVNRATEKGQDVYYFRGEVNNNNVIWSNKCWKIVRTTYTGGVKMIYNGTPSDVVYEGATFKECLATGTDTQISVTSGDRTLNEFIFNRGDNIGQSSSPADAGYMYGMRIEEKTITSADSLIFTFSNGVSRNGDTYTLDTSAGQSITGTWEDERRNAAVRYHYFCIHGETSCSSSNIGYIYGFSGNISSTIYYLNIGGYDDIEDAKAAMFENTNDSEAKEVVEAWFEREGLDENDLEDAIFCNDRSYSAGSLKSEEEDGYTASAHGAYTRNTRRLAGNNYSPSLDCPNQNDAFTKADSTNGNAKLNHKIGLITADELTMAGAGYGVGSSAHYLYTGQSIWSISPFYFVDGVEYIFYQRNGIGGNYAGSDKALRPLVSLKAGTKISGGTGLKTDPYIVE